MCQTSGIENMNVEYSVSKVSKYHLASLILHWSSCESVESDKAVGEILKNNMKLESWFRKYSDPTLTSESSDLSKVWDYYSPV